MAGNKTVFVCSECGYESRKWLGKCPGCQAWNTFHEETIVPVSKSAAKATVVSGVPGDGEKPMPLPQVAREDFPRCSTGMGELDRVLGGGVVAGSLILIGGDPGIGKSTLLLQAAENLARQHRKVLYISGEESTRQVAMRAARLHAQSPELLIYSQTHLDSVLQQIERTDPDFVVIDSIQTMYRSDVGSAPGSVSQVRESAAMLMQVAKTRGCSIFVVGHVTKAGVIAGPRVLEHIVDTVLYFEGDEYHAYRLLRSVKNRFGSTQEIGLFEMREEGMVEITNPSEMFLSQRDREAPGSVVAASMEGSRPMLVELQALVASTSFGNARRQSAGIDYNRMVLLLAVLEKRAGYKLYDQDVYLNVAGGLRLVEPAADLAAILAVASGFRGAVLPRGTAVFGEVSLTGEIRPVRFAEQRLWEMRRTGFTRAILPARNAAGIAVPEGMELVGESTVAGALTQLQELS